MGEAAALVGGGCSVAVTPGYNALLVGSRETGLNHERGNSGNSLTFSLPQMCL